MIKILTNSFYTTENMGVTSTLFVEDAGLVDGVDTDFS